MAATGEDILAMSDEDFLKMPAPVVEAPKSEPSAPAADVQEPAAQEPVVPGADDVTDPVDQPAVTEDGKVTDEPAPAVVEDDKGTDAPVIEGQLTAEQIAEAAKGKDSVQAPAVKADEQQPAAIDYKAGYEKLMAPLKANGKTIDIRNPEELIQLAQQGANYTRKMQELAPKRKLLMMMENNGLDENQLSFFLDLKNKNPEAIKKLLKDSGIDPMDLDTSVEPAYKQGNHRVSDEEESFQTTLDDVRATDEGKQTLQVIHNTWDQASKEALWTNPQIMSIMHEQRASGVYDLINAEVDRQKTLGHIGSSVPFLQAYKAVGDQMVIDKKFDHLVEKKEPPVQTPPAPIATRTAAPKVAAANSDKARAASPTQATQRNASPVVNPLAMSDEDFLKLPPPR